MMMTNELALVPPPLRWQFLLYQDLMEDAPLTRGGSNFICRLHIETEVPKLDKNGRKTRYKAVVSSPCNYRCKLNKPRRMLQHMRKVHGRV